MIQQQLAALGYDPGNTDGELTKQTAIAITRFQAANGMEITGKPTPQLAGILGAAVDAKN
jgi:carboxyl-terminal processing protease